MCIRDSVASPIVEIGEADYIISFEKLEAARYAPYLKKGGRIIVNTQEIDPMPVITGAAQYPSEILGELSEKGVSVDAFDALSLAEKAGSIKAVNIVLMGLFAKYVGIQMCIRDSGNTECADHDIQEHGDSPSFPARACRCEIYCGGGERYRHLSLRHI